MTLVKLQDAKRVEAARKADKYIGRDGREPNGDLESMLSQLEEMAPAEYGRRRHEIAEEIEIAATFLDLEYKERRKRSKEHDSDDALPPGPDPWPEPVDGIQLLDDLKNAITQHMVLRPGAAEMIALWVLFTHAHDCFEISPVLAATSPTPECGKTTLLSLLGELVPNPLPASNITGPAFFRAVDKWAPTVLIDEADTFLRDSDELRGILNSGHNRRNAWVVRTHGDNHEPRRFRTWTPKAVALIGKLPPTLSSRSLHIKLQRKLSTETVSPLRADRLSHLSPLHRKAARWAKDNAPALLVSDPDVPPELQSRIADNWRPLLAIADRAGGHWPDTTRRIAKAVAAADRDETAAIMLLSDLREAVDWREVGQLHSEEIVAQLVAVEDRPWGEWKSGKPLTKTQLAKLLSSFEVAPKQIKIGGVNKNGYELMTLKPVFARYLGSHPLPLAENIAVAGDSIPYPQGGTGVPKKADDP
jgi:putative DNA primase/helicase